MVAIMLKGWLNVVLFYAKSSATCKTEATLNNTKRHQETLKLIYAFRWTEDVDYSDFLSIFQMDSHLMALQKGLKEISAEERRH